MKTYTTETVEEYLARGGKITKVPLGYSKNTDGVLTTFERLEAGLYFVTSKVKPKSRRKRGRTKVL